MTAVGNKLRLTVVDSNGSGIQTNYLYKVPAGDFDVQVTISNFVFNGDDRLRAALGVVATNQHFDNSTGFVIKSYPTDPTDNVDVLCSRYLDGGTSSGNWDSDIGAFTTLSLRITRVGTTMKGYYQKDSGSWVLSWSTEHEDMTLADRVILALREYNGGNDGGSVDFDNLKFNKAECPTGDTWSTTTTSTTSSSTCSTYSITTTTEAPP